MRLATWNVNSLKVRLPHVLEWLGRTQPDVLALQETKLIDSAFPLAEILASGYRAVSSGQPAYNGVAVISREPAISVCTDLPGSGDSQRRLLAVTIGPLRLLNVYVPNGHEVGSAKYHYKLDWLRRLRDYLEGQLLDFPNLVVVGDFNVAPEDRDVYDPAAWAGQVLCSAPEREGFAALLAAGLSDAYRLHEPEADGWTWWDYRMAAFRRNQGVRIDHILVSAALRARCTGCRVDREPRAWDRPSDHAPLVAELAL